MPEPDAALITEFAPARREAWLALVAKVLKGADFNKRLVSSTRDGLAIQPLYTRADAGATAAAGRSGWYPGGWDVRQRHWSPTPRQPTGPSWRTWRGALRRSLCRSWRRAKGACPTARRPLRWPCAAWR